jgi:hypothetical protein
MSQSEHIHRLRSMMLGMLALYAQNNENVDDAAVLGALAAVLCQALIIRGNTIDDEVLHVLRETYKLVEIEYAMNEKEEAASTH